MVPQAKRETLRRVEGSENRMYSSFFETLVHNYSADTSRQRLNSQTQ